MTELTRAGRWGSLRRRDDDGAYEGGTMTEFLKLEKQISAVLRVGMAVTTVALTLGLIAYLAGWSIADSVLVTGLVTIVAIPVGRIAVSFIDAIRRRDWILAAAPTIVLSVMFLTFLYAIGRR